MAGSGGKVVSVLLSIICISQCLKLKCPLVWVKNRGPGVDAQALPTSKSLFDNYIVRVSVDGINSELGNFPTNLGYAIVPNISTSDESTSSFTSFDVLTNPYECIIAWELTHDEYTVQLNEYFIGRATYNGSIIAGDVLNNEIRIATPAKGVIYIKDDLQYLTSYSEKLILDVGNVTFTHDAVEPTYEFIGIDEIHNRSPATVKQTVEHTSRAFESLTVSTWSRWHTASRFNLQLSYSLEIPLFTWIGIPFSMNVDLNLGYHSESDDAGFDSKTVHRETEKTISVGREIKVNPFTSIQACSLVVKIKDFKGSYTSVDKYFAPGLSGTEVKELLHEDGITHGIIEGDSVMVANSGNISADLYVTSRFLVTNYDLTEENPCTILPDGKPDRGTAVLGML